MISDEPPIDHDPPSGRRADPRRPTGYIQKRRAPPLDTQQRWPEADPWRAQHLCEVERPWCRAASAHDHSTENPAGARSRSKRTSGASSPTRARAPIETVRSRPPGWECLRITAPIAWRTPRKVSQNKCVTQHWTNLSVEMSWRRLRRAAPAPCAQLWERCWRQLAPGLGGRVKGGGLAAGPQPQTEGLSTESSPEIGTHGATRADLCEDGDGPETLKGASPMKRRSRTHQRRLNELRPTPGPERPLQKETPLDHRSGLSTALLGDPTPPLPGVDTSPGAATTRCRSCAPATKTAMDARPPTTPSSAQSNMASVVFRVSLPSFRWGSARALPVTYVRSAAWRNPAWWVVLAPIAQNTRSPALPPPLCRLRARPGPSRASARGPRRSRRGAATP